jgi:hypothetical protein
MIMNKLNKGTSANSNEILVNNKNEFIKIKE